MNDVLYHVWLKLAQCFLGRFLNFLNFVNVFSLLYYHLPSKRAWHFMWTNFNSVHPRILCAKLGWNWPCGSREDQTVKCLNTDGQTTGNQKTAQMSLNIHKTWESIMWPCQHVISLHIESIYFILVFSVLIKLETDAPVYMMV